MTKKLMVLSLIAIIIFGVFGLAGCDNISLADYKANKSQALQEYADAKGVDNYCTDDWAAICKAVTDGKAAIDDAITKLAVTTAFNHAKGVIDAVEGEGNGLFYSLDFAFDKGWLTVDELQSIAHYYYEESIYHNHSDDEPFTPIPKNPPTLSSETQNAIKQAYLDELKEHAPDATLDNVRIDDYYGTYGDYVIVVIFDNYFDYDYLSIPEYYIGDILFRSFCAQLVQVWKVE